MIELRDVSKQYRINNQVVTAVNRVSLTVKGGEIFAVMGKSGAGKSSLLRCVNLLERPDKGSVLINGTDLMQLSKPALRQQRQKIGMIFQHFNLLTSRDAFANIALPLALMGMDKARVATRVMELLALVNLTEHRHHYPDQLSGGQKQRVAIARALASHPDILLCDEATSALDPEATASILQLLRAINQKLGLTILLITHELDVIKRIGDRALVLDKGRVVEQGATLDLFLKPKHAITQRLVQKNLHLDFSKETMQSPSASGLASRWVQLTFIGEDGNRPIISELAKHFSISVNIKHAEIEKIKQQSIGFSICELMGEEENLLQAIAFIKTTSIQLKVFE